ncbi:MAG: hypothetical protein ACODAD_14595 [Planctomycetota bacterium]
MTGRNGGKSAGKDTRPIDMLAWFSNNGALSEACPLRISDEVALTGRWRLNRPRAKRPRKGNARRVRWPAGLPPVLAGRGGSRRELATIVTRRPRNAATIKGGPMLPGPRSLDRDPWTEIPGPKSLDRDPWTEIIVPWPIATQWWDGLASGETAECVGQRSRRVESCSGVGE